MRETVGLVDTNYRAFFSFTGPDRQRYVNAILTSNVRDLKSGQGAVGLLLNPQGHILAEVETFLLEDSLLACSHAMIRERTFSTFDKFIIMDDVTLEDVTPSTGTLDLVGPRTVSVLEKLGIPNFKDMQILAHTELSVGTIPCRAGSPRNCGRSCRNADLEPRTSSQVVERTGDARSRGGRRTRRNGSAEFVAA